MNLKKVLLFSLVALGGSSLQAQQSVHTSGGTATGAGGTITYSIGQAFDTYNSGATGSVAEGVQQASEVMLGVELTEINLQLAMYPNPTTNYLNLGFGDYETTNVTYQFFDLQGKEVSKKTKAQTDNTIEMSAFPAGVYLLTITKNERPIKIYKIIKN